MGSIRKVHINGKEILFLDYSFTKEAEMIGMIHNVRKLILEENKPQLILSNLGNSYLTPAFMNVVRNEIPGVLHLINKQALIGLNQPKGWILKGLNFLLKTNYRSFDTEDEAVAYLTTETN